MEGTFIPVQICNIAATRMHTSICARTRSRVTGARSFRPYRSGPVAVVSGGPPGPGRLCSFEKGPHSGLANTAEYSPALNSSTILSKLYESARSPVGEFCVSKFRPSIPAAVARLRSESGRESGPPQRNRIRCERASEDSCFRLVPVHRASSFSLCLAWRRGTVGTFDHVYGSDVRGHGS